MVLYGPEALIASKSYSRQFINVYKTKLFYFISSTMLLPDIDAAKSESSSSSSDILDAVLESADFTNQVNCVVEGPSFRGKQMPAATPKRRPRPSSSSRKRKRTASAVAPPENVPSTTFQRLKFNHEHLAVSTRRNQNMATRCVLNRLNEHINESIKQRDKLITLLLDESFQPCIENIETISVRITQGKSDAVVLCMICMKAGSDTQITNCKCIGHKACFEEWFQSTTWCCCGMHTPKVDARNA